MNRTEAIDSPASATQRPVAILSINCRNVDNFSPSRPFRATRQAD